MGNVIREIIEKHIVKAEKIEKEIIIQDNINNNYYGQRKYEYIDRDIEKTIKNDIEEYINSTSVPRDYKNNLDKAYKIYVSIRREFEKKVYNTEYWLNDFFKENSIELDSPLANAISNLLSEIGPDLYNLVSCAEDIMSVVEATRIK